MIQRIANPVNLCPDVLCMTSLSNVRSLFNKKNAYFCSNYRKNWLQSLDLVRIKTVDIQNGKHCAAFDKVPHQRLLLKLKAHGIGNDVINWIEKWLTHRRQRIIVDGEILNWKSVLSGVPKGSVLGPILFLIYTNDLEDDISSKVLKFADDTKVYFTWHRHQIEGTNGFFSLT